MTLLWHLAKKDIRAARLPLLIWMVLCLFDALWQVNSAPITMEARLVSEIESFLRVLLPLGGLAAVLLIVSTIVHADPLVVTNAFWLTRPIPPRRLFASKLATLALLILGPPIVAESLVLVWFHVPATTMVHIAVELAFTLVIPLLVLFVAASLTPDARRFMLLLIVGVLGIPLAISVIVRSLPMFWMTEAVTAVPRYADPTRAIVVTMLTVASLALVVRRHYVRREWHVAAASAVLAIAGALLLTRLWPASLSLFGGDRAPDAAWTRPDVTRLRRDGDGLHVAPVGLTHTRAIAAPLVLDGLPADYTAAPFTLSGEMAFADGTVVRGGRANVLQMAAPPTFRPSLTLTYGALPLGSGPTLWEGWPVLLQIDPLVLGRRMDNAARYTGTFRYRLAHHEPLATLPIRVGETYVDGPRRLTIRALASRSQCRVGLEIAQPEFVLRGPREATIGFHFVDRQTGARLRAVHEWTSPVRGTSLGAAFSGVGRAFAVRAVTVWVEDMATRATAGPATPRRCDDTSLVVVRTTPAGALTRTIEIPDLRFGSSEHATRSRVR